MNIKTLDQAVIDALSFFSTQKINHLQTSQFKFPIVVGSGNAYHAGKIIFAKDPAIFASESNLNEILLRYKSTITKMKSEAIVISASGGKDSIWEIKALQEKKIKTSLLTCSKDSEATKIANKSYFYKKISEPYTYNVSTYLGMILSATQEKPQEILKLVKKIKLPKNFKHYDSYAFIIKDDLTKICPMITIKRDELFGPYLNIRAFSFGQARHAKFVNPSKKELVISIGERNNNFGDKKHRWDIKLAKHHNYASTMALSYYIIGKIQQAKPSYFKNNIENYCQDYGPKAYGKKQKPFEIIVPEN
jgi:hypothetical protein